MSFVPKTSEKKEPSFTYDRHTWKDYVCLIGKSPHGLCAFMQPRECRDVKDAALRKKCEEMFKSCVREVRLFEVWSRMN